jgi:hypothetical protein
MERREELNEIVELNVPEDPYQKVRPPWLPHPELRETVPNVSLFSCLYQLPNQITTANLPESATDLERQLAATVDFFDQCVPNQPGYSSSVVAVTILPEPAHVSEAWKKWYSCAKQLRKLRFIRYSIQRQLEQQAKEEGCVEDDHADAPKETKSFDNIPENEGVTASAVQTFEGDIVENVDVESGKHMDNWSTMDEELPLLEEGEPSTAVLPSKESHRGAGLFFDNVIGSVFGGSATKKASEDENIKETVIEKEKTSQEARLHTSMDISAEVSNLQEFEPEKPEETQGAKSKEVIAPSPPSWQYDAETPDEFKYSRFDVNEVAKSIGLEEETMTENLIANIGIEQLSVYAREHAQM